MMHIEGTSSDEMRRRFVAAPEIQPCPFCGKGWLKPERPVSPIVFHPGVIGDNDCALAGQGFRDRQFALLNRRAAS